MPAETMEQAVRCAEEMRRRAKRLLAEGQSLSASLASDRYADFDPRKRPAAATPTSAAAGKEHDNGR